MPRWAGPGDHHHTYLSIHPSKSKPQRTLHSHTYTHVYICTSISSKLQTHHAHYISTHIYSHLKQHNNAYLHCMAPRSWSLLVYFSITATPTNASSSRPAVLILGFWVDTKDVEHNVVNMEHKKTCQTHPPSIHVHIHVHTPHLPHPPHTHLHTYDPPSPQNQIQHTQTKRTR